MPHYMFQGSYTDKGLPGLMKDGGTGRRAAIEQLASGMGGRLVDLYYQFGEDDVLAIVELPDDASAAGAALAVAAAGAVNIRTTKLLTPEEIDAATQKTVEYRPPGG